MATGGALDRIGLAIGDITAEDADAIVNAANTALRGGGGVDGAIHRAAGPALLAELVERYPHGCETGEACPTAGHALRARHVIHTAGPVYRDGTNGEAEQLAACHRNAIAAAAALGCATVSFPAISTGIYGYPPGEAAEVAMRSTRDALERHAVIERVRFVLFDRRMHDVFDAARELLVSTR